MAFFHSEIWDVLNAKSGHRFHTVYLKTTAYEAFTIVIQVPVDVKQVVAYLRRYDGFKLWALELIKGVTELKANGKIQTSIADGYLKDTKWKLKNRKFSR